MISHHGLIKTASTARGNFAHFGHVLNLLLILFVCFPRSHVMEDEPVLCEEDCSPCFQPQFVWLNLFFGGAQTVAL